MTKEKAAEAAVEAVKTLSLRVNIPQHLSDLGIQESDLDRLPQQRLLMYVRRAIHGK